MLGSKAMYLEILLRDDLDETDTAALDSWYLSQPADLGIVIPILEGKLVKILQCQNMFKCLKYCNCKVKTISDYQSFTVNIMFSIKKYSYSWIHVTCVNKNNAIWGPPRFILSSNTYLYKNTLKLCW